MAGPDHDSTPSPNQKNKKPDQGGQRGLEGGHQKTRSRTKTKSNTQMSWAGAHGARQTGTGTGQPGVRERRQVGWASTTPG